jgi:hypothetical protein
MTTQTTKTVSVWYDDRAGVEAGWVARCTESEDDRPVLGRIAMDEPVGDEDTDAELARQLAADHWGVPVDGVTIA